MSWPVIIVTGANSGVGFGICERLLCQLSEKTPTDVLIKPAELAKNVQQDTRDADQFLLPCEGLTLIMACRNVQRAQVARSKLLQILDAHVNKLRNSPGYDGHADLFRRNVEINIHSVDLALLGTVPQFVEGVQKKYPYVSHLICNAGVAPFSGMNWIKLFKQLATDFMSALTTPRFYLQTWGELSVDGFGWVWQCNVFGHYTLFKELYPLLSSSKYPFDSRVIWTSSLESKPTYEPEDWQLKKTQDPYGSSKYQTELLSMELDRLALDQPEATAAAKRVRHFTAHPGVCHTNIDIALINPVLHYLKHFVFYLARWCGSLNHTIDLDKGAVSVVWLSIISLSALSMFSAPKDRGSANASEDGHASTRPAVKFAAQTDWAGKPRVGITEIQHGEENGEEAKRLVRNCEKLYGEVRMKGWRSEKM